MPAMCVPRPWRRPASPFLPHRAALTPAGGPAGSAGALHPGEAGLLGGSRSHSNQPEHSVYSGPSAPSPKRVTLRTLREKYGRGEPLSMVTAYDYPSAVHVSWGLSRGEEAPGEAGARWPVLAGRLGSGPGGWVGWEAAGAARPPASLAR